MVIIKLFALLVAVLIMSISSAHQLNQPNLAKAIRQPASPARAVSPGAETKFDRLFRTALHPSLRQTARTKTSRQGMLQELIKTTPPPIRQKSHQLQDRNVNPRSSVRLIDRPKPQQLSPDVSEQEPIAKLSPSAVTSMIDPSSSSPASEESPPASPAPPATQTAPATQPQPRVLQPSTGPFAVRAPRNAHFIQVNDRGFFDASESNDRIIGPARIEGREFGFDVENGRTSQRVVVDGLVARNITLYGGYLGGAVDWHIRNSTLHQAPNAREHGLRLSDVERISIDNTTIDSSDAGKFTVWAPGCTDGLIQNSILKGGLLLATGHRPGDISDAPRGNCQNFTIKGSTLVRTRGPFAECIAIWPGSDGIHLEDLDITTDSDIWMSIDSRDTAHITWKNIRVNGKLVSGFEGVKLGGDMTIEQARAKGIGPAEAPAPSGGDPSP